MAGLRAGKNLSIRAAFALGSAQIHRAQVDDFMEHWLFLVKL